MRNNYLIQSFTCLLFACGLLSCTKDLLDGTTPGTAAEGFTLIAEYGTPETRAAFDSDGLGLSWEPGDKLYLVDPNGKIETVTLTTAITAPTKSASFTCDKSVLSGNYIVLYGRSTLNDISLSVDMTDHTTLKNRVILYGTLTVTDGQTSANISLKHAFAKLSFQFKNIPYGLTSVNCGMAARKDATPALASNKYKISNKGISVTNSWVSLTCSFGWNSGSNAAVLLAPINLSDNQLYFYVYGTNSNGDHVTYEFAKDGIDIKEGMNYNLTLDFNTATISTITTAYELSTPAQFRAAAYWSTAHAYKVSADVDFTDETYIPIRSGSTLDGNNHTLSNITIDFKKLDYVGIVSESSSIKNLNVNNISVIGRNYVGALFGYEKSSITISKCNVTGDINITGSNYVGGLCGYAYDNYYNHSSSLSNCIVKGEITVSGKNYVGGLCGYKSYVNIKQSAFEATVTSSGQYAGGIVGYEDASSSYAVTESYVKGTVNGVQYVGGIAGNCPVNNSYFIGETNGNGISGNNQYVYNCYTYGTITGYGIASSLYYSSYATKNLTSARSLTSSYNDLNSTYEPYCDCGPEKTFLSKIDVINGDEKFSTQCWPDIAAKCPLLQWQAEGFGGDITIPGFGDENWN